MTADPTEKSALMRSKNFRWLLSGGSISMLGDQFTTLALPWLVLKMSGSSLTMGLVIALMGVPRAIFILFGGALVDRYSPKSVLMLTKYINAALLGALTIMVALHQASMPVIYALSLGIGLASAFSIPSGSSILPQVVEGKHLQMANGILMGIRQMSMLAGPLLAGLLIGLSGGATEPGSLSDARGLAFAFGFDCFSFLISAWTLAQVQAQPSSTSATPQGLFAAVGEGLQMVWRDLELRTCFAYWAVVSMFIGGAFQVAMPVLASEHLQGATALGMLFGAHGLGTLFGMALSGAGGKLRIGNLGTTMLCIDIAAGLLLLPLGHITAVWQGAGLLLALGMLGGFMQVGIFSWIQRRVPAAMLGRAMSIFMFIFMGLAPLSAMAAGWALQYVSVATMFAASGYFLMLMAGLAFAFTPLRKIVDA